MSDRPAVQQMLAETDSRRLVALWCANAVDVSERTAALGRALRVAAAIDAEAAELLDEVERQALFGARAFVRKVDELGGLRPDLTVGQAADLVWAHMGPSPYVPLVLGRGWSVEAFEAYLDRAIAAAILAAPEPRGRRAAG